MFYIRKRSIKYNGKSFAAHLLQTGSDVHMGMVENSGRGGKTRFVGTTVHVQQMVQAVARHFEMNVSTLMDYYMDIAEGFCTAQEKPLVMAIASYKPE